MALPNKKIKSIKIPTDTDSYEVIPERLQNSGYELAPPTLNNDTYIGLEENTVYNLMSPSSVAGSSTSGSYLSVRWYASGVDGASNITTPYNGMKVLVKIPRVGVSTAGVVMSLNGDTDAEYHPVALNVNSVLTSHFPVGSMKVFVYDATATMSCYITSNTATTITGVWKAEANYDSNTTVTYGTLAYYFRPYAAETIYRYKFVMLDKDNRLVPLTTTNVSSGAAVTNQTPTTHSFRPEKIYWYNTYTTINAGSPVGGNTLVAIGYNANSTNATSGGGMAVSNFNETVPAYRMIYLCGTYDRTTGLFTLRDGGVASSKNYYKFVPTNTANITLSSYFTSGYDYILLGGTYSSNTYVHLMDNNPMYHFDGTNLVPYDTYNSQTIKTGNVTFGPNDVIDIVAGSNVSISGDATNKTITINSIASSVKTLDTTATFSQSTSSDEAISGTGTITLHKISKTGSYGDLLNKPTYSSMPYGSTNKYIIYGSDGTSSNPIPFTGSGQCYIQQDGGSTYLYSNNKQVLTSHQSIKSLNTNNSTEQTVSASEAINGSGTISLHKISKTGKYSDLIDTPTIPIKVSDLTNDSGFISGITSSDVTTALGYTPYNSSNPNGYTSNAGTVTSITIKTSGTGLSGGSSTAVTSSGSWTIILDSASSGIAAANKVVTRNAAGSLQSFKYELSKNSSTATTQATISYNDTTQSIDFTFVS